MTLLAGFFGGTSLPAASFQVTITNDSGTGSLRWAITNANASPGADTISFNLPSSRRSIRPLTALPTITDPVLLDGTTQPGFAGSPIVELDGANAASGSGLHLGPGSSGSTLRGFVINRFSGGSGVLLENSGHHVIQINFLGTDPGSSLRSPNRDGLTLTNSSGNLIGGTNTGSVSLFNVCSGNSGCGVSVLGVSHFNAIAGNFIGLDRFGSIAVSNAIGLRLSGGPKSNTIGGPVSFGVSPANFISGNRGDGAVLAGAATSFNLLFGNTIGADGSGSSAVPNGGNGIALSSAAHNNTIGLINTGSGNTIRFNGGEGIRLESVTNTLVQGNYIDQSVANGVLITGASARGNRVSRNSILLNGCLGINLQPAGEAACMPTPNDADDSDNGPNGLQNYPVITLIAPSGGSTAVNGIATGPPNQVLTIDVYRNNSIDPSGFGEGQTWLGNGTVNTGPSGSGSFSVLVPPQTVGAMLVATAAGNDGTSEFGPNHEFQPIISIANTGLIEGNSGTNSMVFTLTLSPSSGSTVSVTCITSNGTATAPLDYAATSNRVSFAPGITSATFAVPVFGDTLYEADETFFVHLLGPSNAVIAASPATGTIINDDTAPGLTMTFPTVEEGDSGFTNAVFILVLSKVSGAPVSVTCVTSNGTAIAPDDYVAVSNVVTIPAGGVGAQFIVPVVGDTVFEPDETFFVVLSNPTNATLLINSATGTILDDDAAPSAYRIVNVIPRELSWETAQNAEPSIAVNPADPTRAIISAFSVPRIQDLMTGMNGHPYFVSTNSGGSWTNFQALGHGDTTLVWSPGGVAYAAFLNLAGAANRLDVGTNLNPAAGARFAAIPSSHYHPNGLPDQPWIESARVGNVDRIYVGFNDLSHPGGDARTASIHLSIDGGTTWQPQLIEQTPPGRVDGAPIRIAANGDTVYAVFQRFNLGGAIHPNNDIGPVIVVRDDAGGTMAPSFQALGVGVNIFGTNLAGDIQKELPCSDTVNGMWVGTPLGQERLGSDLSIAVDPLKSNRVFVVYADVQPVGPAGTPQLHVVFSEDFGTNWCPAGDLPLNSALPALAIARNGVVGLLYTELKNGNLETHLTQFSCTKLHNDFQRRSDDILAVFPDSNPGVVSICVAPNFNSPCEPYIGDYEDLQAVSNSFYGTFSASNEADPAHFPEGALFQRSLLVRGALTNGFVLGPDCPSKTNFSLASTNGLPLTNTLRQQEISIDPYYFTVPAAAPGDGTLSKWSQFPGYLVYTNYQASTNNYGIDRPSDFDWRNLLQFTTPVPPNRVIADDFRSDGRPIVAVRWWGSYLPGYTNGFEDGFAISFFSDTCPTRPCAVPDAPGDLIGTYIAPLSAVQVTETCFLGCDTNRIYQYEVALEDTCLEHVNFSPPIATPARFQEVSNTIYWLAIDAFVACRYTNENGQWTNYPSATRAANHFWGWHTSPTNNLAASHFGDVVMDVPFNAWIYDHWTNNPILCEELDQAFELLTETNQPPMILIHPFCQTGYCSSNVTFSVKAKGSRPLSYQWYKDGSPIPGATNKILTLTNLQQSLSGSICSVVVQNSFGRAFSRKARLEVEPRQPPKITVVVFNPFTHSARISFTTEPGCSYTVEYIDFVFGPTWHVLSTIPGDGTLKTVTDPNAGAVGRFYRVRSP